MTSRGPSRFLRSLFALIGALALLRCGRHPGPDALIAPEADAASFFVPVVLSSAGANGSFFSSEMTLTNRGTTPATLVLTYTAANGGGSGTGNDTLAAGAQKVVPDAIAYLRSTGVPLPASGNRYGTLRVAFSGLSSPTAGAVTVRTTTPVPAGSAAPTGRAGLAYAGVPLPQLLSTGGAWLCGLRQSDSDRTNVAIQNAGSADQGDVRIRATYYAGDGGSSTASAEQTLSPGGFFQYKLTDIAPSATQGFVEVERVSGSAPWYAYAVINDNANSDGSFVTPLVPSSLPSRAGLTLPVVVETSTFSSEVMLTNFGTQAKRIELDYVSQALTSADKTARLTLTLAPGQQQLIPAYVQHLRDSGVAGVPAAGPTFTGSLFATVPGGDVSGLSLGARTSNPGDGGRFGLFYAARPYGTAVTGTEAWLFGLQQNAENRTNLAILSTGEADSSPIRLRIEIFDGTTGTRAATVEGTDTTLAAHAFNQLSAILSQYAPAVSQAYARVTRTSGQNGFVTYAVVNDGGSPGERSGDGAFVAMSVDTSFGATFSGPWNNTTFGSSGPVTLVVTGDTYTQLFTGTATVGGNVFGGTSPPPQTYSDVFTFAGGSYSGQSSFFGRIAATFTPTGQISGTITDVPSPSVSGATFTGSFSPPNAQAQTITLNSTIALRPAGTAQCQTVLNRQP